MRYSLVLIFFVGTFSPFSSTAQCDFTQVNLNTQTASWGSEVSWELLDESENIVAVFSADADNTAYQTTACLPDGCYLLHAMDSYGDGWNGGVLTIVINGEEIVYSLEQGAEAFFAFGVNTEGCTVEIPGCTDPQAVNYNPLATVDDGSCATISDILEQQRITPLFESGPKQNRINWAIQNRGMENPSNAFEDEAQFVNMLQDSLLPPFTPGTALEKEPYARYRNFFNVYAWWWPDAPSQESGWSWAILKGIRDLHFLPWADEEHGWATLFSVSRTGGGGGAGVQPETRTGDGLMFGVGWETLLHEFAHTMPQVPDEYSSSGEWSGGNCWESANTTSFTVRDSIPWRKWIDPGTPLPTTYNGENLDKIGAFEGALTNYFGCHRPTARGCYMGAGGFGEGYGQDLCPPCRQRVICQLYKYVDVIENPVPAQTDLVINGTETLTFSADIVKPAPNTQVYTWLLNGKVVAQGVEEVELTLGSCATYELTLTVEDTISWVRYDEYFDNIYPRPFESHTWLIEQAAVEGYELSASAAVTNADCSGLPNGSISFDISGSAPPFSLYRSGELTEMPHTGLETGSYDYWIVDSNGCGAETSAEVGSAPQLAIDICTEYTGDWSAEVKASGYPASELSYQWSNGADDAQVSGLPDGDYSVSITTSDGCVIIQTIRLEQPQSALSASHKPFASSLQENNGAIYLTVTGGRPAYDIRWFEKKALDLTIADPSAAAASGDNFDHLPVHAFDDDLNTKWLQLGEADLWLSYFFPEGRAIQSYSLISGNDVPERDPMDWRLEGSMNGVDWVTLDIQQAIDFPQRRQRKSFQLENEDIYTYYRLFITANHGADAIQLQELELTGTDPYEPFRYNPSADGQTVRQGLSQGTYRYEVKDQNQSCKAAEVNIGLAESFVAEGIAVVPESSCRVAVADPQSEVTYYWLADEEATEILAIGNSFEPPAPGNYWVAAVSQSSGLMSANRPGFSVTMPASPLVSEIADDTLGVENPDASLTYYWYAESCGSTPIHEGATFAPGPEASTYWVSAWWAAPFPEPTDPASLPGLVVHMDAADLNGDGELDVPAPVSSSLYDWSFRPDNGWGEGSWFAFRGNQQNGLGIADFATIWLQCTQEGFSGYQTVIMAYEENPISWKGSAPFSGLSPLIPYSASPDERLFDDNVPAATLNGKTYLNGKAVNPATTPNPMEFCILAQTFTESAGWTDCTDTHWEGRVGEMLFFEEELEDEQLIGISEYLRRKWISSADLESPRTSVSWDGSTTSTTSVTRKDLLLQVFPNPATEQATLLLRGESQKATEVFLYDAVGQLLYRKPVSPNQQVIRLDDWVQQLSSGIYALVAQTPSGQRLSTTLVKP